MESTFHTNEYIVFNFFCHFYVCLFPETQKGRSELLFSWNVLKANIYQIYSLPPLSLFSRDSSVALTVKRADFISQRKIWKTVWFSYYKVRKYTFNYFTWILSSINREHNVIKPATNIFVRKSFRMLIYLAKFKSF